MKRKITWPCAPVAVALLLAPVSPLAAGEPAAEQGEDAGSDNAAPSDFNIYENLAEDESLFDFSYVSPSTPVLPLIGVEGDQIARIGALRPFAIAVLPGLGGSGNSSAVALDISPYWAIGERTTNLYDYARFSPLDRIAARARTSVAVAWGDTATDRPSSLVVSIGSRLFDSQDKLLDQGFRPCLDNAGINQTLQRLNAEAVNARRELLRQGMTASQINAAINALEAKRDEAREGAEAEIEKIHAQCVLEQAKRFERASGLDAGVGVRFNGRPGSLGGLEQTGTVFWSTWTSGVFGGSAAGERGRGPTSSLRARAAVSVRYTLKEAVFSDTFVLQGKRDALALVGGIESAPPLDPEAKDSFRWGLQAGWNRQNAVLPTEKDRDYWRYQALAQLRVGSGVWLNATVGRVSGKGVDSDTQATIGFTFTPPTKATRIAEAYADR